MVCQLQLGAIAAAEPLVGLALGFQLKADVFPGLQGDCSVAFYEGTRSVEVIVRASERVGYDLHVEEGRGIPYRTLVRNEEASLSDVIRSIIELATGSWKSPVSSRSEILMETKADFRMLSSSTLPAVA